MTFKQNSFATILALSRRHLSRRNLSKKPPTTSTSVGLTFKCLKESAVASDGYTLNIALPGSTSEANTIATIDKYSVPLDETI